MEDKDHSVRPRRAAAANDNGSAELKIDPAVLRIARLLARQIAREEFERGSAATDNRPLPVLGPRVDRVHLVLGALGVIREYVAGNALENGRARLEKVVAALAALSSFTQSVRSHPS